MRSDEKINIGTLSRLLDVSSSTVSRVLSGKAKKYRISKDTEKRIVEKAGELGFRPNYLAHSLNAGKTHNIGLVFANSIDLFLGSIMEGVESFLRDTEYQMVVATCENDPELEKKEMERMSYRQVDGIIIYPSAVGLKSRYSTDHLKLSGKKEIPIVVIGRKVDLYSDCILFSDYDAGRQAAELFLSSGMKNFGIVTQPIKCSAVAEREKGYVETLLKNGINVKNIHIAGKDETPFDAQLGKLRKIDCIFGVNTGLLIKYVSGLSIDINSLMLQGVGREDVVRQLKINITDRDMPSREMGIRAAETLLWRMKNPHADYRTTYLEWP
jgi:LacI family transcriptional regulator